MSDVDYGGGVDRAGYRSQSCAACKFQRRRCAPNCPLAPFFPSNSIPMFLNAKKLFGVKNILKMLKKVTPDQRNGAMKTLIYEANARAADPIGGSYRIICQLRRQIEDCESQLDDVRHRLTIFRPIIWQDSFPQLFSYQDSDYQLQPPVSISRGIEQHRGGIVSNAEGQETEPGITLEDCFTHLLP